MGTYYNILYHGNLALDNGLKQLDYNYEDDYWHILPLERMTKTAEDSVVYGQMVEVPQSVQPTLQRGGAGRGLPALTKNDQQSTSVKDAFSAFNKSGTAGNRMLTGIGTNTQQNRNAFGTGRQGNALNRTGIQGGIAQQSGFNNRQNNFNNRNTQAANSRYGQQNSRNIAGQYQNSNTGRGQLSPSSVSAVSRGGQLGRPVGGGQLSQQSMQSMSNLPMNQRGGMNGYGGYNAVGAQPAYMTGSFEQKIDRAEEKATKAIQKHNMLIDGQEYNPQMKDAFMLLGKARYYDQRYFPALEAFNYIISKYDDIKYIRTAEIWREKVYLRLENYNRVIQNLTTILNDTVVELPTEDRITAATALTQTYIDVEDYQSALPALEYAIQLEKDKTKLARYLFVKGQLYDSLHKPDSADIAYNQIIDYKRRIPRIYRLQAFAQKAAHFDYETGDTTAQLEHLTELLVNRENRPYLDIVNYRIAEHYRAIDSMPVAILYYNDALRSNTPDHGMKYRIYKTLGNYYFDQTDYKLAGAYYDSTMVNLPEASREYRHFRRKRLNLNDVIFYESVAVRDDSILQLVRMSPVQQKAYFQTYVDSIKAVAIAEAKQAAEAQRHAKRMSNMFTRQQSQAGGVVGFYFYNPAQVANGRKAFEKIWGHRELQDNWRTEKGQPKSKKETKDEEQSFDYLAAIEADPRFDADTYIKQLPTDTAVIDSISDERNFAYYQLGVIYRVQFKEYQLAADKFEGLLANAPEERLVLPSKYNLYKIYSEINQPAKADKWKQNIITQHPESRYAKILRNPQSLKNSNENPIVVYNGLYKRYDNADYTNLLADLDHYITVFTGNAIVPKMELLKAVVKGRLYGYKVYGEALNYVALTYPQTEEGKKAEDIIQNDLPKIASARFQTQGQGFYNLIYPFKTSERQTAMLLKTEIDSAMVKLKVNNLRTSIDVYSPDTIFVVVQKLLSKRGAEGFGEKVKQQFIEDNKERRGTKNDFKVDWNSFGISSRNYEVLQMHKNLELYLKVHNK